MLQGLLAAGYAVAPGERYRLQSPPAVRITTAAALEPADAAARGAPALGARAPRPGAGAPVA